MNTKYLIDFQQSQTTVKQEEPVSFSLSANKSIVTSVVLVW